MYVLVITNFFTKASLLNLDRFFFSLFVQRAWHRRSRPMQAFLTVQCNQMEAFFCSRVPRRPFFPSHTPNVKPSLIYAKVLCRDIREADPPRLPEVNIAARNQSMHRMFVNPLYMTARLRADSSRRVEGVGPAKPWQPHSTVLRSGERCQLLPRYIAARKDEWKGLKRCAILFRTFLR